MAGNKNSGSWSKKPFRDALNMQIIAAGEDHKALRRIAQALLDKAYEGDMQAIKEVAERLDGKVPQALQHEGGESPIRHEGRIELVAVRPNVSQD
jgi:hypothetical protein